MIFLHTRMYRYAPGEDTASSHLLIGPHVSFFAFRDIFVAVRPTPGLEGLNTPSFTKDKATIDDALVKSGLGAQPNRAGSRVPRLQMNTLNPVRCSEATLRRRRCRGISQPVRKSQQSTSSLALRSLSCELPL